MLVDADAAAFLEEFRSPATIASAVLRHATATTTDPEPLLDQVSPLISRLLRLGLLVRESAGSALTYRLEPGHRLRCWTITGTIQTLEDSEVYRARDPRGREAAIKIARRREDAAIADTLAHESSVLARLAGASVPAVLEDGTDAEWPYLAVEWVAGDDGLLAARKARQAGHDVVKLCASVVEAYAQLHERGVVHADVHPKNLVVGGDGVVTLVDFGLARVIADGSGPPRQGVGYFFEPEYARAALNSAPLPPATLEGEAYAVAALTYLLVTGAHYIDFPLQRRAFLAAIAQQAPTPFLARGLQDRTAVENSLDRAMAKEPSARSSCRQLADELMAARPMPQPRSTAAPVADPWQRYQKPRHSDEGLSRPPTGSVHYGSAGVAYAMLRVAQLDSDPAALAAADAWLVASMRSTSSEAFCNPLIGITADVVGRVSLHHGSFGLSVVRALIAHARWDPPAINEALRDVVTQSRAGYDRTDLVSGLAGVLLGLAQLAEVLPADPLIDRAPLAEVGHRVAQQLAELGPQSPPAQWPTGLPLGVAHGLAGSLHAQLRWAEALNCLPSQAVEDHLTGLAGFAEVHGDRGRWPDQVGRRAHMSRFSAGWCNGAAGHALLFSLAARVYPARGFGDIALAAAHEAWLAPDHQPSLCCGLAGRAFALLDIARMTGDAAWRSRAASVAKRITIPPDTAEAAEGSLYKGALGVHLLHKELEHAEVSAFPLFSSEAWARRDRMCTEGFRGGAS
nr:protein kinase [Streptomyces sp. NBC_00899]